MPVEGCQPPDFPDRLACLHLAGTRVSLAGAAEWAGVLARRYDGFDGQHDGCSDAFAVTLHASGTAPVDPRFVTPLLGRPPRAEWSGTSLTVDAAPWHIALDMATRRGDARGPAHRTTVDMLLHLLLPLLVAEDGLVLHGALLADERSAWICSGPSGSGKSTLARLLPAHARCDELSAVRRRADGWEARSLPFWQGRPSTAPLEGIYLLRHGASQARRRLGAGEATRRLSAEVRWPCEPGASARALRTLDALLLAVPVWELAFRPTADVWDVLSAPAAAGDR